MKKELRGTYSAYKHAIRDWVQKITAENCEKCLKGEETSSCHPIGLTRDHLKYAMQNTRRSVSENDIKAWVINFSKMEDQ